MPGGKARIGGKADSWDAHIGKEPIVVLHVSDRATCDAGHIAGAQFIDGSYEEWTANAGLPIERSDGKK